MDCSFAAALFLPDESSAKAEEVISSLPEGDEIWVPSLWWMEISNVTAMAVRRERLTHSEAVRVFHLAARWGLHTDAELSGIGHLSLLDLAMEYSLTAYDAIYLELALRLGARLLTFDKALGDAAQKAGVPLA
jgi:predicted nucleic acid-binding protein